MPLKRILAAEIKLFPAQLDIVICSWMMKGHPSASMAMDKKVDNSLGQSALALAGRPALGDDKPLGLEREPQNGDQMRAGMLGFASHFKVREDFFLIFFSKPSLALFFPLSFFSLKLLIIFNPQKKVKVQRKRERETPRASVSSSAHTLHVF